MKENVIYHTYQLLVPSTVIFEFVRKVDLINAESEVPIEAAFTGTSYVNEEGSLINHSITYKKI